MQIVDEFLKRFFNVFVVLLFEKSFRRRWLTLRFKKEFEWRLFAGDQWISWLLDATVDLESFELNKESFKFKLESIEFNFKTFKIWTRGKSSFHQSHLQVKSYTARMNVLSLGESSEWLSWLGMDFDSWCACLTAEDGLSLWGMLLANEITFSVLMWEKRLRLRSWGKFLEITKKFSLKNWDLNVVKASWKSNDRWFLRYFGYI
jgi:hypothetical protein